MHTLRKKRKKRKLDFSSFPKVVAHFFPDNDPDFFETHKDQGLKDVPDIRHTQEWIPAQLYVKEYIFHDGVRETDDGETLWYHADRQEKLIPNSMASPSVVANVATNKMINGLPLYRQSLMFSREGIRLSRQTLSNWCTRTAQDYLDPLYQRILQSFSECGVVQIDETTQKVIQSRKNGGNFTEQVLVGRSGPHELNQMAVYVAAPNKKMESYEDLFSQNFEGHIECDAVSTHTYYKKATLCYCLTHARRPFVNHLIIRKENAVHEKLKTDQEKREFLRTTPNETFKILRKIVNQFNQQYTLESDARKSGLSKEKLLDLRQTKGIKIFEELSSTIHKLSENSRPGNDLYKAAQYFMKHEDGLRQYLGNAEVPIDNNACERAVKVFVMFRKNFLFSNTEIGAESTAMYFTILELPY